MPIIEPLPATSIRDPELVAALERAEAEGLPGAWLVRLVARVPEHGKSLLRMIDALHHGGVLPSRTKHLVGALLAERASSPYFYRLHEQALVAEGVDPRDLAEALLAYDDAAGLSDRERLALRFAEQVVLDAKKVDDAFYAELHALFSEPEIMELGTFVGVLYGLYLLIGTLDVDPPT